MASYGEMLAHESSSASSQRGSTQGSAQFPPTQWSLVVSAAATQNDEGANALECLCEAYWYPLYAYVRRRGHSVHDAQDLTQAYFEKLLEKRYLEQADRDRGKFRTFLLASLKHFLANEWNRVNRLKRGGQFRFVSWDHKGAEERYRHESGSQMSADALYDKAWVFSLLETTMSRLRGEYEAAGKGELHEALEVYLTGNRDAPSYAETGEKLGLSESAMKMAVLRMRKRFGKLLRNEVAQTVASSEEIEDEMRYLTGLNI